jgi:uncharacterized membrane protein
MALILFLLCFSALCWVVVLWSWRNRLRRFAEATTATDCRRMDIDRLQHPRRRNRKPDHLRIVASKQR